MKLNFQSSSSSLTSVNGKIKDIRKEERKQKNDVDIKLNQNEVNIKNVSVLKHEIY